MQGPSENEHLLEEAREAGIRTPEEQLLHDIFEEPEPGSVRVLDDDEITLEQMMKELNDVRRPIRKAYMAKEIGKKRAKRRKHQRQKQARKTGRGR